MGAGERMANSLGDLTQQQAQATLVDTRWPSRQFRRWALLAPRRTWHRRGGKVLRACFPAASRRERLLTACGFAAPDHPDFDWITPSLAVGARIRPHYLLSIARAGVTCVVDTRSEAVDDANALAAHGILFLHLPTPDNTPLTPEQLREGAQWINARIADGHRILVHCENGIGRSGMTAVVALMASGMRAEEALRLAQKGRWQIAPNRRQVRRLAEIERAISAW